jgi:beta-exotoxin I transport system permease protein
MTADIARVDLVMRRRSTIGYSVGLALYTLVVVALYPAFKDATDLDTMLDSQPGLSALFGINGSLTSPDGWLSGNVYANFFPLILLFVTIGHGAATIAGEEGRGRLDLLMILPVGRRAIVAQKALAMTWIAGVVAAVTFVASLLGRPFDVDVDVVHLLATTVAALLLALAFGFLALAIGAGTGERGLAIGVSSAAAAAAYLLSSLAPLVGWLEPWRVLSPFYWSVGNGQLASGVGWRGLTVLVAITVAALVASVVAFDRHDVSA